MERGAGSDQQSGEEEPGKSEPTMIEVSCLGLLFIELLEPSRLYFPPPKLYNELLLAINMLWADFIH